jgi:predicted phosphodiesterase
MTPPPFWRKSLGLALAGLAVAACGDSPAPDVCRPEDRYVVPFGEADPTFHVGPALEHTTTSTVAIGWETLEEADTRLEFGADEAYGRQIEGPPGTMHRVRLEGLEPGTRYHYRACSGEQCTRDLVFGTAPEPGDPIRFAVYGDSQSNPENHAKVAGQVMQDEASLVIVAGDTVSDGNYREQYKEFFYDPARALSHSIPRYAAIGNHDRKDTEGTYFREYHQFPEEPGVPQTEVSYSFVHGDAFFLVLDNTMDHYDLFFPPAEGIDPPLWVWLQERVQSPEAQAARWRFAIAHYPPDSACYPADHEYGMPDSAVRTYVLPVLWAAGFQAYFAGHIHCYERFDFDGRLVITTGGGGGDLDPEERCVRELPVARAHACVHHHVTVELGCDQAQVWVKDLDGAVLERLDLFPDGRHALAP